MQKEHGIIEDERGQDQPRDKQRAQQAVLTDKLRNIRKKT
jgi:hypothetical protein